MVTQASTIRSAIWKVFWRAGATGSVVGKVSAPVAGASTTLVSFASGPSDLKSKSITRSVVSNPKLLLLVPGTLWERRGGLFSENFIKMGFEMLLCKQTFNAKR